MFFIFTVSQPSSAPHTPSPAGSMSAKEPSGQGGEHSPAYSQVSQT